MNWPHLHLILNHLPVVGALAAGLLLAAGLFRRSEELSRAAFAAMALVGLAALAAFLTGEPAEEALRVAADLPVDLLHAHEEAAEAALWAALAWGALGAFGFFRFRGGRPLPRAFAALALAGFLAAAALLGYAAALGGRIRHPEARPGAPPPQTDVRPENPA